LSNKYHRLKIKRYLSFSTYWSAYQARDKLLIELSKEGHFGEYAKTKPITYAGYISRKIWKKKRERVLDKYEYQCQRCASQMEDLPHCLQVHHMEYTKENLVGSSLEGLLLLCKWCHNEIEFDTSGSKKKKRSLEEANKAALQCVLPPIALQRERNKKKLVSIDLIHLLRDAKLDELHTSEQVDELEKIFKSQIAKAKHIINNDKIVAIASLWHKQPKQKKQNKKTHKRKKKAKRKAYRGDKKSVPHGVPEVKPPEPEEKCKKCGKNPVVDKHKQSCNKCISKEMVWEK
jgi:hypothetical protein